MQIRTYKIVLNNVDGGPLVRLYDCNGIPLDNTSTYFTAEIEGFDLSQFQLYWVEQFCETFDGSHCDPNYEVPQEYEYDLSPEFWVNNWQLNFENIFYLKVVDPQGKVYKSDVLQGSSYIQYGCN